VNDLPLFNLQKLKLGFDGKPAGVFTRIAAEVLRARVTGGWLVLTSSTEGFSGVTFFPDPAHSWDGGSLDQG
jgi:hypothetical protein